MPSAPQPSIYLSFDDGPHPVATPFVLQQLAAYGARASFFCIGKCVQEHPEIFTSIQKGGHTIGNHTHNHLNGWKTPDAEYLKNIQLAGVLIPGRIFRPPYGRITRAQATALRNNAAPWKIYMWSVLSGDFNQKLSPEKCLDNVLSNLRPGSIVVFHDSEKAWERLRYSLPLVLAYCKEQGWAMERLPSE